ncbi:hypothetical protein [Wolbachia pipientis]
MDVNLTNKNNETPLHCTIQFPHAEVMCALLTAEK